MNLAILGLMVVVGVASIVALVHFTGDRRNFAHESDEYARAVLAADFPDEQLGEVLMTADRKTAFIALVGGGVGLVHSVGARFLTRLLKGGMPVERDGEAGLKIRFRDLGWSGGTFVMQDAAAADRLQAMLEQRQEET